MLEILKTQTPPPDTSTADTTATDTTAADTSVTDTTAQDSSLIIGRLPSAGTARNSAPKLYFDAKEQALFIRTEKNGIVRRYRVTGRQ